jgi:hypothetical protein
MRRVIHTHIATKCIIRQPALSPVQPTSLNQLPLQTYSAVTRLDLSQCLDWIQHPSLRSLADLSALLMMPQLKEVDLRPLLDHIDSAKSFRIKSVTGVLCWADDVMFRIWDRWKLAPSAGVPALINVSSLAHLSNLQTLTFPITKRHREVTQARISIAPKLRHLTELTLGRAVIESNTLSVLKTATSLRSLSLGRCAGFSDAELEVLSGLQLLDTLYLHGCDSMQISSSAAWAPLTRLQRLTQLALYARAEGENTHFWGTVDPTAIPLKAEGVP